MNQKRVWTASQPEKLTGNAKMTATPEGRGQGIGGFKLEQPEAKKLNREPEIKSSLGLVAKDIIGREAIQRAFAINGDRLMGVSSAAMLIISFGEG
jgi:hypothetical protein